MPSPPPIESEELLFRLSRRLEPSMQLEPAAVRLSLWDAQRETIEAEAKQRGIDMLDLPSSVRDSAGFLAPDCVGDDATHGNDRYGERVVDAILKRLTPQQRAAERTTPQKVAKIEENRSSAPPVRRLPRARILAAVCR